MYRIPGAYSRKSTTSAPAVTPVRPTRDPPPDRGLNDVVVRRLLTVGQDLQAALGLMTGHPASGQISHAVNELDQAIREIQEFCPEIGEGRP